MDKMIKGFFSFFFNCLHSNIYMNLMWMETGKEKEGIGEVVHRILLLRFESNLSLLF